MFNLPLQVKIALFLFSHGNEIVEFGEDQLDKSIEFARERFEEGKAFLEEKLEQYNKDVLESSPSMMQDAVHSIMDDFTKNSDLAARCVITKGTGSTSFALSIAEAIKSDPHAVRQAIDFCRMQFEPFHVPSDFTFHSNVASNAVAYHVPTGEDRVRYDELTGAGVNEVHAVLDTGVDSNHPDLKDKLLGVFSEVPGEDGEDRLDHGTHVCGTLFGPKEICLSHNAKGISIKVLGGPRGSGQSNWIESGIHSAIDWRGPNGERVTHINLSLGGGGFHQGTHNALKRAQEAGIIVNAAAGNDGWRRGVDLVNEPARSVYAFAYGAIDQHEQHATFTSPGPTVDGAAPGVAVISSKRGGGRIAFSGTSMATPVGGSEGACAQSFLVGHGYARLGGTVEFREFHAKHARDIFDPGSDDTTGEGRFDVYETLVGQTPDDITSLAAAPSVLKTMMASVMLVLISYLGSASAPAQTVETIEVQRIVQTVQRELSSYDGVLTPTAPDKIIDEKTSVTNATRLVYADPIPVNVRVLKSNDFQDVKVTAESTVGQYVLTVPPGKYLVIAELPSGASKFLPICVDGPPVPPVPEVDMSSVRLLSATLANAMNDQSTRSMLIDAYNTVVLSMHQYTDLQKAEADTKAFILTLWPNRPWESQGKNWVEGFQRPMQAEFKRLGVNSLELYSEALQNMVEGLQDTQPTLAPTYSPIMYIPQP